MFHDAAFHPGARLLGDKLKEQFDALNAQNGNRLIFCFCVFDGQGREPASLSSNICVSNDRNSRKWLAHYLREAADKLDE